MKKALVLMTLLLSTAAQAAPFHCSDSSGKNRLLGNLDSEANWSNVLGQTAGSEFMAVTDFRSIDIRGDLLEIKGVVPMEEEGYVFTLKAQGSNGRYAGTLSVSAGESIGKPIPVECTFKKDRGEE